MLIFHNKETLEIREVNSFFEGIINAILIELVIFALIASVVCLIG